MRLFGAYCKGVEARKKPLRILEENAGPVFRA